MLQHVDFSQNFTKCLPHPHSTITVIVLTTKFLLSHFVFTFSPTNVCARQRHSCTSVANNADNADRPHRRRPPATALQPHHHSTQLCETWAPSGSSTRYAFFFSFRLLTIITGTLCAHPHTAYCGCPCCWVCSFSFCLLTMHAHPVYTMYPVRQPARTHLHSVPPCRYVLFSSF